MAKMHPHKLSPITCDYEQLILIGYNNYNQFEISYVS